MRFVTTPLRNALAALAAALVAFSPAVASAQNGMPHPWQMNLQPANSEVMTFIHWFHDFGIPVGGVVVNMRIDKEALAADAADFVKNRVAMQDQYMQEINETFDGLLRAIVPLFDDEVRGVPSLSKTADLLLA